MSQWMREIESGYEVQPELRNKFRKRIQSRIVANGIFAYVELTRGLWAKIDIKNVKLVCGKSWQSSGTGGYVTHGAKVFMHRVINGTPPTALVDHANCNVLDNTDDNLRRCTRQQNNRNTRRSKRNSTGYKGVCFHKRDEIYQAQIRIDGRQYHLGNFATKEEAARVYQKAALKHFGEFARFG